jgi:FMN phosphatase YigB (HAD superfamily)
LPNLPADLQVYRDALAKLYERLDGIVEPKTIDEWVLQFKPEHRRWALRLASSFSYFSQEDIARWSKQLYARIESHGIKNPCFVGFGQAGKSGSLVAYHFCKANELSTKAFVSFENIGKRYQGHDAIVLLDDFLGMGDQAVSWWTNNLSDLQDAPPIYYLVLVGFEKGKHLVESITGATVEVAHSLTEMDQAFFPARVFEDFYESRSARDVFHSYGEQIEPEWPLGYGGNEALVAFVHNTPNNTLPVFWSKNKNWIPLFQRHESKRAKSKCSVVAGSNATAKHLLAYSNYLKKHEAVFSWECPDGKAAFDSLNSRQAIALLNVDHSQLYALTDLGLSAGVASGLKRVVDLAGFCALNASTVWTAIEASSGLLNLDLPNVEVHRLKGRLVVLDWSDTLVDEYDLDEAICSAIPRSRRGAKDNDREALRFRELLADLEQKESHRWYDYVYLGRKFGKTAKDLADLHETHSHLLRPLCDVKSLVGSLRRNGFKVALSTNCTSRVLEWRAKLLGLRLDSLFEHVVTSDITANVRDKGGNLDYLLEKASVAPSETIVVGDSFSKDILPAKVRGAHTVWLRSSVARKRSYWGTPELPISPKVYEPARAAIEGRAADCMILNIVHLLNILDVPLSKNVECNIDAKPTAMVRRRKS